MKPPLQKGINHALTRQLLSSGCSVVLADLKLRPEAQATLDQYPSPSPASNSGGAFAAFHRTDMANWNDISSLWEASLKHFSGRVDVVVNGAGIFEPPSSSFWNPPGVSPLARDPADAEVGQYNVFAVNAVGPIRLAQVAVEYWLRRRREVGEEAWTGGSLLWVASMGAYVHSMTLPLYFASKAAVVSFVRSTAALNGAVGVRNAVVCPGPTLV